MTLEEYMRELILMSRQYGQEEELYPLINMLLRENKKMKDLSLRDVHGGKSAGIRRELLNGYGTFPDFAILDENYSCPIEGNIYDKEMPEGFNIEDQLKYIYGCVEVKTWNKKNKKTGLSNYKKLILEKKKKSNYEKLILENKELKYELLWYGRVLYTNGLCWYYVEHVFPKNVDIIKELKEKEKKLTILINQYKKNKDNEKHNNIQIVDIGNMSSAYDSIIKPIINQTNFLNDIGQLIEKQQEIIEEWKRLKYNLASIDWCGTNDADKFLLKPQI